MLNGGLENGPVLKFLFSVAIIISSIVFFVTKKKIVPALVVMSILSNIIVYWNKYVFDFYYNLPWLADFSGSVWPWINLVLVLALIRIYIKDNQSNKK